MPDGVRRLLIRYSRLYAVLKDTVAGTWDDGFTHAGNIAYLSLVTVFPFFILIAVVAGAVGRTEDGLRAVQAFLGALPADVAALVAAPIVDVIQARTSGGVVTFGIIVTIWTVSGFVENLRAIIRRAYRAPYHRQAWRYRLIGLALVFAAVLAMLAALAAQVVLGGAEAFVAGLMPGAMQPAMLALSRLLPMLVLMAALWGAFTLLTPRRFNMIGCPTWPGALVTTLTWAITSWLLPRTVTLFGGYAMTYGSLAGVIIALLFFYIIGLGLVVGAHLNAALAKDRQISLKTESRTFDTELQ
ncbi:YihY/virulence factor BrkB family protein [Sandarakinorhabdus sp.]|uniref:YihY/virulence factor BrkB family protein n=1 Tax=Sandarakinorhabdus sp. TaxID=1916663 RepID=UPI00286E6D07|nr:YihY/virulence factor BrkB family protein [Sandarakinorhabdus sp.]